MKKTKRKAVWNFENNTVLIPINAKIRVIAKTALDNKRGLWWKLDVSDGKDNPISRLIEKV